MRPPGCAGPVLSGAARKMTRHVQQPVAVQPAAEERGVVGGGVALDEGEIDQAVGGEARVERDVEEAAVFALKGGGRAGDRPAGSGAFLVAKQVGRPLAQQHAAVGQERERPGVPEAAGDGVDHVGSGCPPGGRRCGGRW